MRLIEWMKQHKLTAVLLIIVLYFVIVKPFIVAPLQTVQFVNSGRSYESADSYGGTAAAPMALSEPSLGKISLPTMPRSEAAPQASVANRLVIENSNLSLLVKDVTQVKDQIIDYAQGLGGYMVNSQVSNPQDAPTATVTIRIPSARLKEALSFFHSQSIKVVSENLQGTDVTDQYVDIDAQIANLEKTKAKFEQILDSASEISDITNLSQQIISIQSQIDSYKGQQDALAKNAELAKVTIYLSTDEIALPYAPSETFRPEVIFKLAVRSLIANLRDLAGSLIWLGVYAVIWIPLALIAFFLYKRFGVKRV